jgi:hypothetical protein
MNRAASGACALAGPAPSEIADNMTIAAAIMLKGLFMAVS